MKVIRFDQHHGAERDWLEHVANAARLAFDQSSLCFLRGRFSRPDGPRGACGSSSVRLAQILHELGCSEVHVVTLVYDPNAEAEHAGHVWIECLDWILDVTIDQFEQFRGLSSWTFPLNHPWHLSLRPEYRTRYDPRVHQLEREMPELRRLLGMPPQP